MDSKVPTSDDVFCVQFIYHNCNLYPRIIKKWSNKKPSSAISIHGTVEPAGLHFTKS